MSSSPSSALSPFSPFSPFSNSSFSSFPCSGSYDCVVNVWDPRAKRVGMQLEGHLAPVLSLCTADSMVVSASQDSTCRYCSDICCDLSVSVLYLTSLLCCHTSLFLHSSSLPRVSCFSPFTFRPTFSVFCLSPLATFQMYYSGCGI